MLDWDDLRFFLAIARHGSLTAAALELRVAQSTVGRRLASLETSLGTRLLHRTPDGYVLTLAGESIREQAERVEAEALAVVRKIGGRGDKLEGIVRITCAETIAVHILAPCFAALQVRHPDILIELIPDPRELSLSMREAEIAIRLTRPSQHDLVVRRIGRMAFGLYASEEYLSRHDELDFPAGCPGHRLMVLLDDIEDAEHAHWLESLASRARLGFQSNSHEALLVACRSGAGLACLARFRGDAEPGLRRIETPDDQPAPVMNIFLVVHKDNRANLGIRAALNAVTTALSANSVHLNPERL